MTSKRFRKFLFLLLLLVPAFILNGCGSDATSSTGGTAAKAVALSFDTDGDGTPDIFDDFPDDANSAHYSACDESASTAPHDAIETSLGKDAPYTVPATFKGDIDPLNKPDYFAVKLEAGKTYSMVFHDPQQMDGRALTFAPDVTVYTGSVSYLVGGPDEEELLQGVASVADTVEQLPVDISTQADSRVVVLSFKAQESRVHYIALANEEQVSHPDPYAYRFDLIQDEDKNGMRVDYIASDGSGYQYDHEDLLYLKSAMKPYVATWASDGTPSSYSTTASAAFAADMTYLAAAHSTPLCTDQTSLSPYISDVPWNSSYRFGYGIDATTGLPANQLQAVKSFTPTVPANAVTKTDTSIYFVNSDEMYSKEIQAGFNTTFSSFGVTFKASGSYTDNIKYSEKETTLILKYYLKESEYRVSDPGVGAYSLTDNAKAYLAQNKDDFRNQYGDYFIAGARYGAEYVATLHIKATSAEEIRAIETKLSQASKTYKFDATEEFKAKFSEATKNATVEVKRTTIGGNESALSAGSTPDQMFDDLKTFIQSCTKDNRAPLQAYLFRFNQMPDGAAIATEINVNSCVFSATRDLSRDFLALTARAKVVAGLDPSTFQAGVLNDYAVEYDSLSNDISDHRQLIFRDRNKISVYAAMVKSTLDRFSDLIDRHGFFLKLVQVQKTLPNHTVHQARESGFKSYILSRTVDNDINKPSKSDTYNAEYHQGWHVGWREWFPTWTPGTDAIVCYIRIDVDSSTKNDDCWDDNYPSLGRDQLKLHFKSGYDRKGSWWLKAKGVYLGENGKSPQGNYPFNWEMML